MKTAIIMCLFYALNVSCFASGMKGSYTIDPNGSGSTNFKSFIQATKALRDSGVSGPIIFNAIDGSYYDYIYLDSTIKGASAKNTVTFQSKSRDRSKVILIDSSAMGFGAVYLSGASHYIIRDITIMSMNGTAISMREHSSFNTIDNCIIRFNADGVYLGAAWVANTKSDTIKNNVFVGHGSYGAGIELFSNENYFVSDLVVSNNIVDSAGSGMYVWRGEHMLITANRFYAPVQMVLTYANGTKDFSLFCNNFICTRLNTKQYSAALYLQEFEGINVFNNSIYSRDSAAFWSFKVLDNSQVKNNIFYNSAGGAAVEADDATLVNYDYNDFYTNGKILCINGSSLCRTLSDWQKKTKMDAHSVSVNPYFRDTSAGDLHLTYQSPLSLDSGIYISPDTSDIDGEKRNQKHPWIGADELSPDTADVGIRAILSPKNNECGSDNASITVKLHNYGLRSVSGFNIYATASGPGYGFDSMYFSGTLAAGKDTVLTINFSGKLSTGNGGTLSIVAWTGLQNDMNKANDTFYGSDTIVVIPTVGFIANPNICLGTLVRYLNISKITGGGITGVIWDFGDGTIDGNVNSVHIYTKPGIYDFKFKVTGNNGCSDSILKKIEIDSLNSSFNFKVDSQTNNVSFIAKDSGLTYYFWDFGDSSMNDTFSKAIHFFPNKGKYVVTLHVASSLACFNSWSDTVVISKTGIEKEENSFGLNIYPNPFKSITNIRYTLSSNEKVIIEVYDLTGEKMAKLFEGQQASGEHSLEFIPDEYNAPAGLYLLKIRIGDKGLVKELVKLN